MRLRYGFLCDYAAAGVNAKPTCVGIFDNFVRVAGGPTTPTPYYVFASIACSSMEGPRHVIGFRLLNADAVAIGQWEMVASLSHVLAGQELAGSCTMQVVGVDLPEIGEYSWEITADGRRIGEIPFAVHDAAAVEAAR